jgi:hypothetical protein
MRIVVLTLSDPWAQTDGGTLRTRAFLSGLDALGHEVVAVHPAIESGTYPGPGTRVLLPAAPMGERGVPAPVRRLKRYLLPMPTATGAWSSAVASALRDVGTADLLLISQLSAARYGDRLSPAGLWLDHSDLWSEFARRTSLRRRGPGRVTGLAQARRLVAEEIRHSGRAAVVTAAGVTDSSLLGRRLDRPVAWVPTPVAVQHPLPPRTMSGPRAAGFIGNFAFGPNVDALDALLRGWGRQLRDRGWDVVVAGLASDTLPLPPWVHRLGPVRSPREFYETIDLALAPIRLGGGMKVKVVEALLYGRPVLATPFAMEGFPDAVRKLVHVTAADGVLPEDGDLLSVTAGADGALQPFTREGFLDNLRGLLAS